VIFSKEIGVFARHNRRLAADLILADDRARQGRCLAPDLIFGDDSPSSLLDFSTTPDRVYDVSDCRRNITGLLEVHIMTARKNQLSTVC
jgi:hypothetical protein